MQEKNYIPFTKEMKKNYTILAPNMLTYHFRLVVQVMRNYGYNIELLETTGQEIIDTGLKYVHNDACYPALLVIGQFINAIESGKYDPHKTALIYFQTGGGCRASNYISLLRKALERAGYGYVPVISFSFANLENHPGFRITLPILHRLLYCMLYGDVLLSLVNQCTPYEKNKGDSESLAESLTLKLAKIMKQNRVSFSQVKKNVQIMLDAFAAIPKINFDKKKIKVGIVGEIYVKFSPLGNNNLVKFLVEEGAEVSVPGLLNFFLCILYNKITEYGHLNNSIISHRISKIGYSLAVKMQTDIIDIMKRDGRFEAFVPFPHVAELIRGYMDYGCRMGEGWLLPAEMLELYDSGAKNIVCAQPFGCLPNHIVGKGMMKPLKEKNPDINIVAIDYDPGATRVNQENRIKLMLANARQELKSN